MLRFVSEINAGLGDGTLGKWLRHLARSLHEVWRAEAKPLIERRIRLLKLKLPIVGDDTRHGRCYAVSTGSVTGSWQGGGRPL
jgi:hypothetical protein